MAKIVASVRAALQPLIAGQIVRGVALAGVQDSDGSLTPIVSVWIAGDTPELHAAEISRLIQVAGLDVQWLINSDAEL